MLEPLLVEAHPRRPRGGGRAILEAMRTWWAVTTDVQYLSSPGSRRWSWRWSLTVAAGLGSAIVFVYGGGPLVSAVDCALFLLVGSLSLSGCCPTRTLYSDAAISVVFIGGGCFQLVMAPAPQLRYMIPYIPLSTLILSTIGIHSVFVAACGFALSYVIAVLMQGDLASQLIAISVTLVTALFSAILEYNTARLADKYHKQVIVTRRLLDTTTNGFCSIDSLAGTIMEASPQLLHTFGCENLVGLRLADFVDSLDDRAKLDQLCVSTRSSTCTSDFTIAGTVDAEREPILVTFRSRAQMATHLSSAPFVHGSFEAKVFLYAEVGGVVSACVQIMGEVRHTPPDASTDAFANVPRSASSSARSGAPCVAPSRTSPRAFPNAFSIDPILECNSLVSGAIGSLCDQESCRDGVTAGSQSSRLSIPNSVLEASRRLGVPTEIFTLQPEGYREYGARVEDHMRLLRTVSDQHLEIQVAHLYNAQQLSFWRVANAPVSQLVLLRRGCPPPMFNTSIWTTGILPFLATVAPPLPRPELRRLPTRNELLQWARRIAWAESELYADDIAGETEMLYDESGAASEDAFPL